jgi:hypothetical protein
VRHRCRTAPGRRWAAVIRYAHMSSELSNRLELLRTRVRQAQESL